MEAGRKATAIVAKWKVLTLIIFTLHAVRAQSHLISESDDISLIFAHY